MRFALTVMLFAEPMFVQEYGCYYCREDYTPDGTLAWCDHAADKRVGFRCYYFEVYG